jgi:hypothetical protein
MQTKNPVFTVVFCRVNRLGENRCFIPFLSKQNGLHLILQDIYLHKYC